MPGRIDLMKSTKVERVSNADRAGYALRASPNARRRKDQTLATSLQQGCPVNDFPRSGEGAVLPFFRRRTQSVGWAKSEYRCGRPRCYRTERLLTWLRPAKIIVASAKMFDAVHAETTSSRGRWSSLEAAKRRTR